MQRFKTQFERETREEGSYTPSLYQPNNTDTIKFKFRGDKMGKVIGKVVCKYVYMCKKEMAERAREGGWGGTASSFGDFGSIRATHLNDRAV